MTTTSRFETLQNYATKAKESLAKYEAECATTSTTIVKEFRTQLGCTHEELEHFPEEKGLNPDGHYEFMLRCTVGEVVKMTKWKLYRERGEWRLLNPFSKQPMYLTITDLSKELREVINAVEKDMRGAVDTAYHESRWTTRHSVQPPKAI